MSTIMGVCRTTDLPPLLTTWGDRGPSLMAVGYYHATYLFVYKFSYVVIMLVHDSVLIADFLVVFKSG